MFKVITGTLQTNHNTMQLTDDTITNDSIFEVYADTENVIPSSVSVGGHTVTITFDSKPSNNVGIKVLINNIVGEFAPDTIDAENVTYTNENIPSVENVKDGLDNIISGFEYLQSTVADGFVDVYEKLADDDTVLGGVLYHATTGNTWKKLDASNLNYDDNSTIYSAMGDIDELETENKNLVDAINEVNSKPSGGSTYQTGEHLTNNTWIDGKPIYRNIIPYTTQTNLTAFSWVKTVVPKPNNIDSFMNAYCITNNQALQYFNGWGFIDDMVAINANRNVSLLNGFYLVLEYTKSGTSTQSLSSIE